MPKITTTVRIAYAAWAYAKKHRINLSQLLERAILSIKRRRNDGENS